MSMVQVFLTIDTECSLGGAWENPRNKPVDPERAILGKIGSEYYGIPRIMDILEEHDLRGIFFIEVLAGLNGLQTALAEAYAQIVKRGHEAQLHLHPVHYYYRMVKDGQLAPEQVPTEKDMIGSLSRQTQLELLQRGMALFREMIGNTPQAFRAGNFGASMSTLDVLAEVGMRFDSSFNAAYTRAGCRLDSHGAVNAPWQHGGLWEIPVTNFVTGASWWGSLKQLSINAVSLWEMKRVLEQADRIGLDAVTLLAHSFSLFKVADLQFRRLKPDRLVLRRFEGLCRFLKERPDRFRVMGFSGLDSSSFGKQEAAVPNMGSIVPALRKAVQAINRVHWM
jgi:hypothetical protein